MSALLVLIVLLVLVEGWLGGKLVYEYGVGVQVANGSRDDGFYPWYTGTGDDGFTGVLGRERVPKYALRPEAYGTVDEASAFLGMARAQARTGEVRRALLTVQRDLYKMMADLATLPETATRTPWLKEERLEWLEEQTDAFGQPGGDAQGVHRAGRQRAGRVPGDVPGPWCAAPSGWWRG